MVTPERNTQSIEWIVVCAVGDVPEHSGVAVLLPGGRQAAVFRVAGDEFYATSNVDPFSRAAVLSRGIVGDADGVPVVASPMHKQRFDLRTGRCLDAEDVSVARHEVAIASGTVYLLADKPTRV